MFRGDDVARDVIVRLLENPETRDVGLEAVAKIADILLMNGPYHDEVENKTFTTRQEFVDFVVKLINEEEANVS